MGLRIPLPPHLVTAYEEFSSGARTPAEPRDAATVVLLRPGAAGPLVYLLRRQTSMAFAGGMCVFPGGGVDPRDFDAHVGWAGPSTSEWALRLGTDEETARALVCAAVRETFEESGVLLAGPSATSVVSDVTGDDWEADRLALEGKTLAFSSFLENRGLVLRSDLLGVWAGWLTPIFEPKRYRTWFFVAVLPSGQRTRDVSTESDTVAWLPALDACARVDAGEILMLPPTYLTCLEVGQHATPLEVLGEAVDRTVDMFTPQVIEIDDGHSLSAPPGLATLIEKHFP